MPLQKTNALLKFATENKFGIPAINVFNFESIAWAIKAAESQKLPIIIQFYPGFDQHIPLHIVSAIAKDLAASASVPVAVHLDHSATFEIAVAGLGAGYPSIMVDGSSLPFDENVALTAAVTRCAKAMGVDVEGELGHVGNGMDIDDITNKDKFTNPDEAQSFIEKTGIDSLAIAVGNGHGDYIKTPELDFVRIRTLREKLSIPLVMHGGSDIPSDQLKEAVQCGMSKFNIATEWQRAFYNASQDFAANKRTEHEYYYQTLRYMEQPCIDFIREKLDILNPNNFHLS